MRNCQSFNFDEQKMDEFARQWWKKVQEISGLEDVTGLKLPKLIKHLANDYDMMFTAEVNNEELSGARLSILLRLYGDELMGRQEGTTPTFLSHLQRVNKNTISSLVRGLEEQGLITRENDPSDRRIYRLRLTETGRELIKVQAPQMIRAMNAIPSELTVEEQKQLVALLEKLSHSLHAHSFESASLRKTK